MAKTIGVTQPTLSAWLANKEKPGIKMAIRIEKLFGIPRDQIRPDIFQ